MASLTRPDEGGKQHLQNPAGKRQIRWNSDEGAFYFHFPPTREGETWTSEKMKTQRLLIVAGNCFRVTGGKADSKNVFTNVSSPIIPSDKGLGMKNEMRVWVGGEKTPAFIGTWNEIEAAVKAAGGAYTAVLFVVPVDRPDELWMAEFKGASVSALIKAKNEAGKIFSSPHVLSVSGTEKFSLGNGRNERTYLLPQYAVQKKNDLPEDIMQRLLGFSAEVDTYTDALVADAPAEKRDAARSENNRPEKQVTADNFPTAEPPMTASELDDLPF